MGSSFVKESDTKNHRNVLLLSKAMSTISTNTVGDVTTAAQQKLEYHDDNENNNNEYYKLKKRHWGCTGMYWRSDPTKYTKLKSNDYNRDWPRDGALLRGMTVTINNDEKWLLVSHVQNQTYRRIWRKAPNGAAIPFEYNNHYYLKRYQTKKEAKKKNERRNV